MAEIIQFPGTEKDDQNIVQDAERDAFSFERPNVGACKHERVIIYDDNTLKCKECEVQLDPVWVLRGLTKKWRWYQNRLGILESEIRFKTQKLEELKRQESNARARVRRIGSTLSNLND